MSASAELTLSYPIEEKRQLKILRIGVENQSGTAPHIFTRDNRDQNMSVYGWQSGLKSLEGVLGVQEKRIFYEGDKPTFSHVGHMIPSENLTAAAKAISEQRFTKTITNTDLDVIARIKAMSDRINGSRGHQPRFSFDQIQKLTNLSAPDLNQVLPRLVGLLLSRSWLFYPSSSQPEPLGYPHWFIPKERENVIEALLEKRPTGHFEIPNTLLWPRRQRGSR